MLITKIHVEQFSNLSNVTLTFDEQPFHLLCGPNETGKSGLHDFLIACFYGPGNQNKQNIAASLRTLRMPWGQNSMAGYLEFRHNDRPYRYTVSFGTARRHDEYHLVDLETFEEIDLGGKMLGEYLFDIPQTVFEQTACIRQMNVAFAGTSNFDELRTRLAGLAETGDSDISYDELRKVWDEEYRNLTAKSRKKAVIPNLEKRLDDLRQAKDRSQAARDHENILQKQIRDLTEANDDAAAKADLLKRRHQHIDDILDYDRYRRIAVSEKACAEELEALLDEDSKRREQPLYFDSDSYRSIVSRAADLRADIDDWTEKVNQWNFRRDDWYRGDKRLARFDETKANLFLAEYKQHDNRQKQLAETESALNAVKESLAAIHQEHDAEIDALDEREKAIRERQFNAEREWNKRHNEAQTELNEKKQELAKRQAAVDKVKTTIGEAEAKLADFTAAEEEAVPAIREALAAWYKIDNRTRIEDYIAQDERLSKHRDLMTDTRADNDTETFSAYDLAAAEAEQCENTLKSYDKERTKAMMEQDLRAKEIAKTETKLVKHREAASEERKTLSRSARFDKQAAIVMVIIALAILIATYILRPAFMWIAVFPILLAAIALYNFRKNSRGLGRTDDTEAELEQQLDELRAAAEADDRVPELNTRIEQIETEYRKLTENREALRKSADEKARHISRMVDDYDDALTERDNYREVLADAKATLPDVTAALTAIETEVGAKTDEIAKLKTEIDETHQKLEAEMSEIAAAKTALSKAFEEGEQGRQAARHQTEIDRYNEEIKTLKTLIEESSESVKQLILTSGQDSAEEYKRHIDKIFAETGLHNEEFNKLHDLSERLREEGENLDIRLDRLLIEAQVERVKPDNNPQDSLQRDDRFFEQAVELLRLSERINANSALLGETVTEEEKRYTTWQMRRENADKRYAEIKRRAEGGNPSELLSGIREKYGETEEDDCAVRGLLNAVSEDTLDLAGEERAELTRRAAELETAAQALREEIIERERTITKLATEAEHIFDDIAIPETIEQEIRVVERDLADAEQRAGDLQLAIDILDQAYDELKRQFSPRLRELTQTYLSQLTGGRYQEVYVDSDMKMKTRYEGSSQTREADYLSGGTTDQIYLALRLAISELLAGDMPVPLILDDIFVQYDDTRLAQGLALLGKYGKEQQRQIIMMTCQDRVAEALPDAADWQCIDLTEVIH